MSGFACSKFEEATGRSLKTRGQTIKWPLLVKAMHAGCISYEDLGLAEFLLKEEESPKETIAAFLCHLSRAAREGHLSVLKKGKVLSPCPQKLWFSDSNEENINDVKELVDKLIEEDLVLPARLVTDVSQGIAIPLTPLCKFNDMFYLQKYWLFESCFFQALQEMLSQKPAIPIDRIFVSNAVNNMKAQNKINEEQAHAILNASLNTFSIICGGPGTGKTYTAGHLIKIVWESLEIEKRSRFEIALAAPTGKAAHNLQKSMDYAFSDLEQVPKMFAKTLHSILGLPASSQKISMKPDIKLNADIILVDESSMIDVRLMSYLFDSIKPGARLILLGDPFQLPPVEAGSLFKDIINAMTERPNMPIFELKKCLRAELQEIVDFSKLVNNGNAKGVLEHLNSSDFPAVKKFTTPYDDHPRKAFGFLVEYALKQLPNLQYTGANIFETLGFFNSFRMLTPLRRGMFGVKEMNDEIHEKRLSSINWNAYFLSPIIITSNDYKMNLFNGEVGVLVSCKKRKSSFQEGEFAIFAGDRKIPAILLPKFEYAYCLSVHKSQGSEFENVLLLLPKGSGKFGRELFYTAATRAKKKLEIWGHEDTIVETLNFKSERKSGISSRVL